MTTSVFATAERAEQPPLLRASVEELVDRAGAMAVAGQRRILGITGAPGAGKSTLCAALLNALGARAALVGMDGFHLAGAELARLGRADRKGSPDTFDVDGYVALLQRLRRPGSAAVYAPVFDRALEEPIASALAVPGEVPLVITEGNYLLFQNHGLGAVRGCVDEVWYLEVDPQVRQRRLVLRRQMFGHSAPDARGWVAAVDEKNAAATAATRGRSDLVVQLTSDLGRPATTPPHIASTGGHAPAPPLGSASPAPGATSSPSQRAPQSSQPQER